MGRRRWRRASRGVQDAWVVGILVLSGFYALLRTPQAGIYLIWTLTSVWGLLGELYCCGVIFTASVRPCLSGEGVGG